MKTRVPNIENHGLMAFHDQACPVYSTTEPAVFDCNTSIFHPSWRAQGQGWRLVKADTWLKRLALRVAFSGNGNL